MSRLACVRHPSIRIYCWTPNHNYKDIHIYIYSQKDSKTSFNHYLVISSFLLSSRSTRSRAKWLSLLPLYMRPFAEGHLFFNINSWLSWNATVPSILRLQKKTPYISCIMKMDRRLRMHLRCFKHAIFFLMKWLNEPVSEPGLAWPVENVKGHYYSIKFRLAGFLIY